MDLAATTVIGIVRMAIVLSCRWPKDPLFRKTNAITDGRNADAKKSTVNRIIMIHDLSLIELVTQSIYEPMGIQYKIPTETPQFITDVVEIDL